MHARRKKTVVIVDEEKAQKKGVQSQGKDEDDKLLGTSL